MFAIARALPKRPSSCAARCLPMPGISSRMLRRNRNATNDGSRCKRRLVLTFCKRRSASSPIAAEVLPVLWYIRSSSLPAISREFVPTELSESLSRKLLHGLVDQDELRQRLLTFKRLTVTRSSVLHRAEVVHSPTVLILKRRYSERLGLQPNTTTTPYVSSRHGRYRPSILHGSRSFSSSCNRLRHCHISPSKSAQRRGDSGG